MFGARPKKTEHHPLPPVSAPPSPGEINIPDVPSLEGYTIDELRAEQLARAIRLEELRPELVALLIRTFTGKHR